MAVVWKKEVLPKDWNGRAPAGHAHLAVQAADAAAAIELLRGLIVWVIAADGEAVTTYLGESLVAFAAALGFSGHEDDIAEEFEAILVIPLHFEALGISNPHGDSVYVRANRADERVFVVGEAPAPKPRTHVVISRRNTFFAGQVQALPPWRVRFSQSEAILGGHVFGENVTAAFINGEPVPAAEEGGGFVVPALAAPQLGHAHVLECHFSLPHGSATVSWFLPPNVNAP